MHQNTDKTILHVHYSPKLLHTIEQQISLLYARLVLSVFHIRAVGFHDSPHLYETTEDNHEHEGVASTD